MLNLAIATMLLLPQAAAPAAQQIPATSLFPTPSGPLTLEIADPESEPTMADLVRQYCQLTGQNAITSADTKSLLKSQRLYLLESLTVPASEVQHTFELLLRQNDFALQILKRDGVRLIEITSLSTAARNNIRSSARYLAPEDIDFALQHPAMLFTTVVTLPNTDVRQVSNSMRTMITDANTQQMLPAGNSNSMVLVGFGDSIHSLSESLKLIDESSAMAAVPTPVMEVIKLENATAANVAELLQGAFGGDPKQPRAYDVKIQSDERTNTIIVAGPPDRLAGVKNLVAALDAK